MFMSLIELNPRSRQVQAELRDPYQMHRTLSRAFEDDGDAYREARCLFRVDDDDRTGRLSVLVQSRDRPDWEGADLPNGYCLRIAGPKLFEPSFREGQMLRFRLRANPTVKRDGKRLGLYRETEQHAWLARKAGDNGFHLLDVHARPERQQKGVTAHGQQAAFAAVVFEGVLQVTNPGGFMGAVEGGVGAAKAFGFGLLSLAPVR